MQEIALKHPQFASEVNFSVQAGKGQVEFEAPLDSLSLNQTLKTPTRILMRLLSRRCRDLPKLYNIIRKYNWRPYLFSDQVQFKVTCHQSRLMHTGRIEQTANEAFSEYYNANPLAKKVLDKNKGLVQSIYLRIDHDDLTISLDTSGELLHRRGSDPFRGKAAIRENIASCLLIELMDGLDWHHFQLIDPMCGSGTFLKEAMHFWNSTEKRSFSFQNFYHGDPIAFTSKPNFNMYFGFDNDAGIIQKINSEWAKEQDLFSDNKDMLSSDMPSIVITNPPYGKRIKIKGNKGEFFAKVVSQIKAKFHPFRMGIIIPNDVDYRSLVEINEYQLIKNIRLFNSGVWVRFLVWEQRNSHT